MVKVLYAVRAVCIRNIIEENNFLFDWIYYMALVYEGHYNCHCKGMKILFILLLLFMRVKRSVYVTVEKEHFLQQKTHLMERIMKKMPGISWPVTTVSIGKPGTS